MLHTTLALLRKHSACSGGYAKLVASLGDSWPDDKPIALLDTLATHSAEDVIWALRATIEDSGYVSRMIAADCAESVLHIWEPAYPDDMRPRQAIEAARAFARGEISEKELADAEAAARAAACDAVCAAAGDAYAAACAAWDAAGAAGAAYDVARSAAWVAARSAAVDAYDAAVAAEAEKQKAIVIKWLTEGDK